MVGLGALALVTNVDVRRMRQEDVAAVMLIERECFTIPWRESAYITEISNRSAYYIVACDGDKIVGYGGMWVIMDEAHITTLGVAKTYRGHKVGEQVLFALIEEAMRHNVRRATLEVRESNVVAQNLYRKYGFQPAAIRRGYYTDNYENAIVMWVDNMSGIAFNARFEELKCHLRQASVESSTGD